MNISLNKSGKIGDVSSVFSVGMWRRALVASTAVLVALVMMAANAGAVTIRIDNGGDTSSLDPQRTQGTWESRILSNVFEGLTSEDAMARPIPGQAESWTISDDGLVYTFKLRDGIQWSDGVPVTANDFVFSFQRLLDPNESAYYAYLMYPIKNGEAINRGKIKDLNELGVKALDDRTVEITLEYPAPYFLAALNHNTGFPVPRHVIEKYGNQWMKIGNIVSNGPYAPSEWLPGSHVTLVKNDKYYDAANVKIDEAIFVTQEDAEAGLRRYLAGDFDIMYGYPGDKHQWLLENIPDQVDAAPIAGVYYYVINVSDKEKAAKFSPKVRQALSMAIDREIITDKILAAGQVPAYGLIPPGTANYAKGYEVSWKAMPYPERVAKAKELMKEAGHGSDNPLKFVLRYNTLDTHKRIAVAIAGMWKDLGVNVELLNTEVKVHYADLDEKDFEIARAGWIADYNDPINYFDLLKDGITHNYGSWKNDRYNELLRLSNNETDLAKRSALFYEAEKIMMEEPSTVIPIYFYVNTNLVSPKVKGYEPNVDDEHWLRWMSIEK